MQSGQIKWDRIYKDRPILASASLVLQQNKHLLPRSGTALDIACGQGGNAVLLAESGLTVDAWDLSPVAIEQLDLIAMQKGLTIDTKVIDVMAHPLEISKFDVITVSYFLERTLCSSIIAALKPSGVLFYQTYCQQKVFEQGPTNPDYLLTDNELLTLFSGLNIRVYREEALLGQHDQGWRNQAMLVAQKPG
ncbi:MAG: class I SAM-dependent methyltransferase [Gammaproteobacteria bacterium]|nr:class I SAM-dependent methyltransferase [Gammaproteobacteria bacterium]